MTSPHDHPAVIETRVVHDVHRRATSLLAHTISDPSADRDSVTTLRDFVVDVLRHHHHSEDHDLWPLLTYAAPDLADPLASLSREHVELDTALDDLTATDVVDAANPLAAARADVTRDLVHQHLAHEEPVLFPALRSAIPDAVWEGFSERTVATAPQQTTDIMLALMYEVASADDVELILRHLPPEARALTDAKREDGLTALAGLGATSR